MALKVRKDTAKEDIIKAAKCRKECANCITACQQGSGAFIESELDALSLFLNKPLKEVKVSLLEPTKRFNTTLLRPKVIREGKGHSGRCIFFKDEGCSIYPVRPLECKVSTHGANSNDLYTWFIVNHLVNPDDPQSIREYSMYIESNGNTIEGGKITELIKDDRLLRKILNNEIF